MHIWRSYSFQTVRLYLLFATALRSLYARRATKVECALMCHQFNGGILYYNVLVRVACDRLRSFCVKHTIHAHF